MDFRAPLQRFDHFQQQRKWTAVPCATVKKFSSDNGGNLAALVAYYGFFSLFPLLLVFVTILGYVLAGDQSLLESVKTSVLGRFPVLGTSVRTGKLHGSVFPLVIGIVLATYSGLGVMQSAENALNAVWNVPKDQHFNFLQSRLRALMVLSSLGVMFIVASGASGVVTGGLGGAPEYIFGILISAGLNFALFMLSFRLLCSTDPPWRSLIPGSVLAALIWTVLQLVGGAYIGHIKHSADTDGAFALVIGVIAWLHLGAQLTMYCAELNVVLARHEWPRSLLGGGREDDVNSAQEHEWPTDREPWPSDDAQPRVRASGTEQSSPATGQPSQVNRPG